MEGVVSAIGTQFKGNTQITAFDELELFGITGTLFQSFMGCSSLRKVTLPDTMTTIGGYSFRYCYNLRAILPSCITAIQIMAFQEVKGPITIYATTPPKLEGYNFEPDCVIFVPTESVDAYKTAWSAHASKIQPIQE